MPRVVALTGATGFIGRAIADQLIRSGFSVKALVRPSSDTTTLPTSSLELVLGSLEDTKSLHRLTHDVEAVIHCAGATRGSTPAHFYATNVKGVENVLQAAQQHTPPPPFLFISSLAAREPHLSHYAASKRAGELVLIHANSSFHWGIFRPPAVYGPGDRELLPLLQWMANGVGCILGPRHARFSLLYVRDLANAAVQWIETPTCESANFEIHDGKIGGYTWTEVIETVSHLVGRRIFQLKIPIPLLKSLAAANQFIEKITGHPAMLTLGKVQELIHPNWVCDNTALTEAIGWTPEYSLQKGINETLDLQPRTG